ncbi:MAG TPA: tetratricopeptide repeat protein, partial [Bacteroidia bacterium]|nr:tetratricopeptide repeat protein [Bacteroidia bacterium]
MKKWSIITSLLFINTFLFAQKSNVVDNAGAGIKSFNANQAFLSGDITRALKLYTEANSEKPNDAAILYHIGQCHYALQEYDQAMDFLQKSENTDSNGHADIHLTLGLVYLQEDQVDNAMKELIWHKRRYMDDPKKMKDDEIDHLIGECATAKQLEGHPVNVKIKNAGEAINSEQDDKSPSITADGSTLIFTSIRTLMVGNMKPSKDPSMVFDNVYMCKWDSAKNDWGLSYPITGDVNEAYAHTSCTSISPDGNFIFLYKNNANGPSKGGDIYMSKKSKNGKWAAPVTLGKPVNTSYYEDGACLSPDGNTIYFVSERPGGYGRADIYKADKISRLEWGKPENLGPVVNSDYDEGAPFMAPDGHTLFFSSDGHNSMGGYDIFKTYMNDSGKWVAPINLGYPINTVNNEKGFTITGDARTAYFASDRKGGMGKRDIYMADLTNYSLLASDNGNAKGKGYSVLRGKVTTSKGEPAEDAKVTVTDSAGAKVAELTTSSDGFYFITLKSNEKFKIKISLKGFKSASKPIKLPES